ncbi:MAG: alpha/beta hydrolase family protein [Vicinamibacterales bacterium]
MERGLTIPRTGDCTRRLTAALTLVAVAATAATIAAQTAPATAQAQPTPPPVSAAEPINGDVYVVFLAGGLLGREELAITHDAEGWTLRGTSRLNPPVGTTVKHIELRYDSAWRARRLELDGTVQGVDVQLTTTFADGKAANTLTEGASSTEKVDAISPDAVVLPNVFFGSYAALAARLAGATVGTELKAYIAPQAEIPVVVTAVASESIDTPQRDFTATRYALTMKNPQGDVGLTLWADDANRLVRISVPSQSLEVAREDVASAASRMTSFSIPGDESVRIAANGFTLAGSVTRPATPARRLPAVVLIGGSGPADRDSMVAGIPVIGQMAQALAEAGFLVVRYDKRGIGQSGGRAETATLADYADDARAVVNYLRKDRKDVDDDRIAVVGHSEGAWVALQLAAATRDVKALVLVGGASGTGGSLVLEQQQHLLEVMKVPDADRKAKAELQAKIHAAATGQSTWEGVPLSLRQQADTPWFASFLGFDPARPMKDTRQPILIVQGELDTQVAPRHAEALAALAKARKREATVDVVKVPGVNHLLVPAKTGEVSEYGSLEVKQVSPAVTAPIAAWLTKTLGPGRS